MVSPSIWTDISNSFNPFEPLSGSRLENWFVEREYSPLSRLKLDLQPDRLVQKMILGGQRGCGKTSELFKLISEIQSYYFTVYIDLFGSLDLETASRSEILFCIGAAVFRCARDSGVKISDTKWKELISSISTLVSEHVHQSDFNIDPFGILSLISCTAGIIYPGLAIIGNMTQSTPRFGFGVTHKQIERLELEPSLREISTRVNAIITDVESEMKKPVFLVADGLDKLESIQNAELIFGRSWTLSSLRCRGLFTIPSALYYSTRSREIENYFLCKELPNVFLHIRGHRDQENPAGMAAMRKLVEKRVRSIDLELFNVFEPEALDYLIRMSGGVMRDLVRLVREAALGAELNQENIINLTTAEETVALIRREMEKRLYSAHYEALLEIEQSDGRIDQNSQAQMDLLKDRYVISYENGGAWRDIHPIVLKILEYYKTQKESKE